MCAVSTLYSRYKMSRLHLTSLRTLGENQYGEENLAAVLQPEDLPVTIKRTYFHKYVEANSAIREAVMLAGLRHAGIVSVYDCYIEQDGQRYRLNLVTEAVEKSLEAEIGERARQRNQWTQEELWQLFKALLSALTYAQSKNISHRNITPLTIFLTPKGPKLTQFIHSIGNLDLVPCRTSIQGDKFYYSPEMKEAYMNQEPEGYDPIKSDVFALGVTMLYAALLRSPSELNRIFKLEEAISGLLNSIGQYPTMQWFLNWMLTIDSAKRPTFAQISDYIQQWEAGGLA